MTAVEWLEEQLIKTSIAMKIMLNTNNELVEQAKEMEKQQIEEAFNFGVYDGGGIIKKYKMSGEQYYNETFKSE
jgi:hypothetical protein